MSELEKPKHTFRVRCRNCKHVFFSTYSKRRYCSVRCKNEAKAMEKRCEQNIRSPSRERKKPWFVVKHMEKIRRHVMEVAKKRKQENEHNNTRL